MKLRVLGRYTNSARNIDVYPGDEIEVSEALGEFLQNDAPGCFEDPNRPAEEQLKQEQPGEATKREAGAVLDEAERLLADAHDQASQTRATIAASGEPKPFDRPPDGTTLATDATPPVITGPDSDVDITFTPSSVFEGQLQEGDEEDDEVKGFHAPPRDKAVKRSPKQK